LPALRLLLFRKPAGAVQALLAYLPTAETDPIRLQTWSALRSLAVRDNKLDPALVEALDDRLATRRLAAAELLLEVGRAEHRALTHRLLKDADALVRLRVGLALVGDRQREAIPTLIDLLAEPSLEQGPAAEEVLLRLAGDKAPKAPLRGDEAARRKYRDAWAQWWQEQGLGIDLEKLENPRWLLGQTLLVEQTGRVLEIDARGKVVWQIGGIYFPTDAQVLPNGRVLILEAVGMKLTERDLTGKILWERPMQQTCLSFERFANGNTFIAMRHQIVEIDRDGKEVFTYNRPGADLYAARKLPDGQLAFITQNEMYFRIDATQKVLKSYRVALRLFKNVDLNRFSSADILPGDRVLVSQMSNNPAANKLTEYDATGAAVWTNVINTPSHAIRLASGNTLVACEGAGRVVELDRTGRIVWECREGVRPSRVHRRDVTR
jgi:hypothetical protein